MIMYGKGIYDLKYSQNDLQSVNSVLFSQTTVLNH